MLYATNYRNVGPGPLDYLVPDGHYKRLRRNPDGTFSLRFREGEVHTFHGPAAALAGRLAEITDRTGLNRLRFEYDGQADLDLRGQHGRRGRFVHGVGTLCPGP